MFTASACQTLPPSPAAAPCFSFLGQATRPKPCTCGYIVATWSKNREERTTVRWAVFHRWRRDPESNRARRICNPLHNRFAIAPLSLWLKEEREA